jgi:hypothetical protein
MPAPPQDEQVDDLPSAGAERIFVLQRTGLRPLRFFGCRLAAFEIGGNGRPAMRLALYGRDARDYAVSLSCEPSWAASGGLPWHHAALCGSLEQALMAFETASPVCGDGIAAAAEPTGDEALAHAARRLLREAAMRQAFGMAVGVFLHQLCGQPKAVPF